jgi:hypothetical protein
MREYTSSLVLAIETLLQDLFEIREVSGNAIG